MIIYRGFSVDPSGAGYIIKDKTGKVVQTVDNENEAYFWIDGEKAVEHKKNNKPK